MRSWRCPPAPRRYPHLPATAPETPAAPNPARAAAVSVTETNLAPAAPQCRHHYQCRNGSRERASRQLDFGIARARAGGNSWRRAQRSECETAGANSPRLRRRRPRRKSKSFSRRTGLARSWPPCKNPDREARERAAAAVRSTSHERASRVARMWSNCERSSPRPAANCSRQKRNSSKRGSSWAPPSRRSISRSLKTQSCAVPTRKSSASSPTRTRS